MEHRFQDGKRELERLVQASNVPEPCSHKYRRIRSPTMARGRPRSSRRSGIGGRASLCIRSMGLAGTALMIVPESTIGAG
jgi:hypothetical protein